MALHIKEQILLSDYTTLQLGGVADYLAEVHDVDELKAALQFAKEQTATPPLILGGGSNVLIPDDGFRGLVIILKISGREFTEEAGVIRVTCGAGEVFDDLVNDTVSRGLWGLENLSAIPGSVGATPVQNVGAYGTEIASHVSEVRALHQDTLEERVFMPEDCKFGYRDSFFKTPQGKQWVITQVVFLLQATSSPTLTYGGLSDLVHEENLTPKIVSDTVRSIRAGKFPDWTIVGTAGSFFKNPIITNEHFSSLQKTYPDIVGFSHTADSTKVSLGWILDKVCDLRGYTEGHVRLYEKQALVLVAEAGATSAEVKQFVKKITDIVFEKTNILIEPEVLLV